MSAWVKFLENYPWLLLLLAPVAIGVYWHRISLGALRLSQQRTQRLYRLMTTGDWKTTPPLALQLAVADAFKRQFDDRAIRLAFTRHRPLQLLSDYRRADGVAVVSEDGVSFIDGSTGRIASHPAAFWVLYVVAVIPWFIATIGAELQSLSPVNVALVALCSIVWTPMVLHIAFAVSAARRLIFSLDERHPPLKKKGTAKANDNSSSD